MSVSYKKLWKLLIDRDMKKRDLCKIANVSSTSLAKLGKGENVNTDILFRICSALNCGLGDIAEVFPSNQLEVSLSGFENAKSEENHVGLSRKPRSTISGQIDIFHEEILAKDNKAIYDPESTSEESFEDAEEVAVVDPRNSLNDLTGREWLPETKSFFFQKGLGSKHPHAQIERLHPAPFSFQDISKLVCFFTKKGGLVLDPFGGVGSTAKSCALNNRICTSIELSKEWHDLSIKRLETEVGEGSSSEHTFINADCVTTLKTFKDNTFDFIVTSPPYWAILNKKADHKVKRTRIDNNLATNYSESSRDLGNISDYNDFLETLIHKVFQQCGRVLKQNRYMCIVVSDFRHSSEFISFHSDIIHKLSHSKVGRNWELTLQGVKILLQNHKSIFPYGYPYAYVENIHHQYVLIFRKTRIKDGGSGSGV